MRSARAGCDVVITGTGRPPERYPDDEKAAGWRDIDSVADEVRALGRRALPVVSDVSDASAVEKLADRVMSELGRVDIVVNNAGAARGPDRVPVVEMDVREWLKVIDTNLNGSFYMSRAFGRHLVAQGPRRPDLVRLRRHGSHDGPGRHRVGAARGAGAGGHGPLNPATRHSRPDGLAS